MSAGPRARPDALSLRERVEGARRSARTQRFKARLPRYIFVGAVALLALVGLREIVAPKPLPTAPDVNVNVDQPAEQLAQRFARAYLSYDVNRPGGRERELASMMPEDLDPDGGFLAERGSRSVSLTEVAQNQEALAGGNIVVVYSETDDGGRFYLAVPIERRPSGALAVAGYPSLVGPPVVGVGAAREREELDDPEILEVARRALGNYLSGSERNLRADLAPGADFALLPDPVRIGAVLESSWADGPNSGAVLLTVEAFAAGGVTYTLTYELGVERQRGRALISFIEVIPTET